MAFDYDLFVIGGGSGGVRAARFTSPLGLKVGLAEEYRMGGTCVIRGCVPKKLLSYAAHGFEDVADLAGYGYDAKINGFSCSCQTGFEGDGRRCRATPAPTPAPTPRPTNEPTPRPTAQPTPPP